MTDETYRAMTNEATAKILSTIIADMLCDLCDARRRIPPEQLEEWSWRVELVLRAALTRPGAR